MRKRVTIVLSEMERDKFVRWCFQAMKATPSAILTRLTYAKIRDARVASWSRRAIYRQAEPGSSEALAYARDYPGSEDR